MPPRTGAVDFNITVLDEAVLEALEERELKSDDLRPAFLFFDRDVNDFVRAQFRTEGAHAGKPWKGLAPETIARRERLRGHGQGGILWDTSNLRGSLIEFAPGSGSLRHIERKRYVRGTEVGYSGFVAHPEGPRPMFPEEGLGILERKLEQRVKGMFDGDVGFM